MAGKIEMRASLRAPPTKFHQSMELLFAYDEPSVAPSHVIIDPTSDDHDLSDYLCGPNFGGFDSCPTLRNCTFDATLTADPALNQTCGSFINGTWDVACYACLHKTLWPPAPMDYVTGAALFVCGVLAGASGIGGGGLNVPLLMLTGSFIIEEAVPLSHIAVFGNAIAQNLINVRRGHPHDSKRPLIDLNMPLIMLPAQLGGNALGVLIGPSLPSSGVEVLACVLLGYASLKTLRTATKSFLKERAEVRARLLEAEGQDDYVPYVPPQLTATKQLRRELLDEPQPVAPPSPGAAAGVAAAAANVPESRSINGSQNDDQPASTTASTPSTTTSCLHCGPTGLRVAALILLWALLVLEFLGSHLAEGHSKNKCAPARIAWLFAQLALILLAVCLAAVWLVREQRRRETADLMLLADQAAAWAGAGASADVGRSAATDDPYASTLPGDVRWTAKRAILLPCVGAFVGLVAGLLGLGGGELMAPLLLALGMLPQVASATSACMVLFTASSNVAHYLAQGILTPYPGYVLAAFVIGFIAALIGRLLALRIVAKVSHPSLIAFVLSGVLAAALGLLGVQMARQRDDWSFDPLCGE